MVGRRGGIDVVALIEDDVVGRVDGIVVAAVDLQRTRAVEQQFAFCVERALVLVGGIAAAVGIGERVAGAVDHIQEAALLAQHVEGSAVRTGDVDTVELDLALLVAHDGDRTVVGGAGEHVAHLVAAMVADDGAAVVRDFHAIDGARGRIADVDGYLGAEIAAVAAVVEVVLSLWVEGRGVGGWFGRRLVNGHGK